MSVSATNKGFDAEETTGRQSPQAAIILGRILMHPTGGVVGLVDDLLVACLEHGLEIEWQTGRCRVRSCGCDWEELNVVSMRKSIFRAILARVAAVCNERTPNSVSPYGGKAELSFSSNPTAVLQVAFVNTTAEQQLKLNSATEQPPKNLQ